MLVTMLFGLLAGLLVGLAAAYLLKWKKIAPAAIGGSLIGSVMAIAFLGGGLDFPYVQGAEQFETEVLQAKTPVMVDFYADTCIVCKMLAPTLESLSKEYDQRVKFVKVEVTQSPDLARSYQISATPTVILFVEGVPTDTWIGNHPAEAYSGVLNKTLTDE